MTPRRLAIVTGCSSGIGLALTRALLADSWRVLGIARRRIELDEPRFEQTCLDLADLDRLAVWAADDLQPRLADPALERVALVNNAARIGELTRVTGFHASALGRLFAVNAAAPIYLMGQVARRVPPAVKLRVVNVSSGAARTAFPGLGDYCASKAALRLAGQALAAELQLDGREPRQAAVFSYEPGVVATAMQVQAREADPAVFPGQASFQEFHDRKQLHDPAAVVGGIVDFVDGDPTEHFTESRYAG